jgi:hypothetical protein
MKTINSLIWTIALLGMIVYIGCIADSLGDSLLGLLTTIVVYVLFISSSWGQKLLSKLNEKFNENERDL